MSNKSGITAIMDRLREITDEYGIEELNDIADQIYRRPAVKRASKRNPRLTTELAEQIWEYIAWHPDAHNQDFADHFGVNIGRVSQSISFEV